MQTSLKTLFFLTLLATAALLSSCEEGGICTRAQGPQETQTLDLPVFSGIDLRLPANVYLTQDTTFSVTVTGPADILERIEHDVRDGVWEADLRGCVLDAGDIEIRVSLPDLHYLRIAGSGNVEGVTSFAVPTLDMVISGSGNMDLALIADALTVTINGSGDMFLDAETASLTTEVNGSGDMVYAGVAEVHTCRIRGAGTMQAYDLQTATTEVTVSGSGDTEIMATERLKVDISGSGDVFYQGDPQLEVRVNGSGRVVKVN